MSATYTEQDIYERLRAKFAPPEWAIFQHLANGTGANVRRWADAAAMGLYPSRGMPLHGFEIKVSRSDWLRELKNPQKAEEIADFCDYWWVVVADKDHVHPGELPDGWGLMYAYAKGLRTATEPRRMDAKPLTRTFVAAILRRAYQDNPTTLAIEEARRDAGQQARDDERHRWELRQENERSSLSQLKTAVDAFNRGAGDRRSLSPYMSEEQAEGLGRLLAPAVDATDVAHRARFQLSSAVRGMRQVIERAEAALEPLGGESEGLY